MRRRAVCLLLLVAVGISACGRPDALQPPPDEPTVAPTAPLAASPGGAESAYPPVMDSAYPPAVADSPYPFAEPAAAYPALEAATRTVDEWTLRANPTATPIAERTSVARGPLLREVLPPQPQGVPATTHLIYSEVVAPMPGDRVRANAFWQIDVREPATRRLLTEIKTGDFFAWTIFGQLSPDGNSIAYLDDRGDQKADLFIIRRDGGDQRRVAQQISIVADQYLHQFAWSPDSTRLVFKKYWEHGAAFYIYDVRTKAEAQQIAQMGAADLGAWLDDTHILVYTLADPDQPWQLIVINTDTRAQEVLGAFPRRGSISTLVAPDRSKILMGGYLFESATRQIISQVAAIDRPALWLGNSQTLLEGPQNGQEAGQLIFVASTTETMNITLLPAYTPTSSFGLLGASPDGQYLVLCEARAHSETQYALRTLLYDVAHDHWDVLSTGVTCGHVLGWEAEAE